MLAPALVAAAWAWASASAAGELEIRPAISRDGVYQASWSGTAEVVLEEALDPRFGDAREVYRGTDRATTLTGRPDGTYHYRLHPASGAPATASVTVEHHPLGRALGFFAIGLVVFGATSVLVLRGPDEGPAEGR